MLLYILYTFMCCTSCMHVYVLLNTVCATRSCEAGWCLMYMVIVLLLRMSCSQILLCLVENCYKLFQDQKKWLSLGDAQHRHDHPVHSLHLGLYNYLRRNFWNWFRKKKCIFLHHLHFNLGLCNYLRDFLKLISGNVSPLHRIHLIQIVLLVVTSCYRLPIFSKRIWKVDYWEAHIVTNLVEYLGEKANLLNETWPPW